MAGDLSGRRAPGFSLVDSDFVHHDAQDYRGKILLLDIMQTSCPHRGAVQRRLPPQAGCWGDSNTALASECLDTARKLSDYEQQHARVYAPSAYSPSDSGFRSEEFSAAAEMLITSRESQYRDRADWSHTPGGVISAARW